MSRKIFVGSLPDGIDEIPIRAEFDKYGQVEEVFVKPGCQPGRQWAFVTYATPEQAQHAKELCDRILHFPGSDKPCDVIFAKNQGMNGQAAPAASGYVSTAQPAANSALTSAGPRKIFVGSLPSDIADQTLATEFGKYGTIEDIFIKHPAETCEPGRQWAFITFSSAEEASFAKQSTDNIISFPGCQKVCEVTLARNQGMFGQDNIAPKPGQAAAAAPLSAPMKVFVGSLPDFITDEALRMEFGRYGNIVDLYLKTGCETGRNWAFITYQTAQQANAARSADRKLVMPGADKPVEVTLARNQGMNGQQPLQQPVQQATGTQVSPAASPYSAASQGKGGASAYGSQPPPPSAQPPAHYTQWRTYYTATGLPYFHNSSTGVTQWECPLDLQVPGQKGHVPPPPAPGPKGAHGGYGGTAWQQPGKGGYVPY